jgi:hypothetical protein
VGGGRGGRGERVQQIVNIHFTLAEHFKYYILVSCNHVQGGPQGGLLGSGTPFFYSHWLAGQQSKPPPAIFFGLQGILSIIKGMIREMLRSSPHSCAKSQFSNNFAS